MPQAPTSKALLQQTVDTLLKHGGRKKEAADALGLPYTTFFNRVTAAEHAGVTPKGTNPDDPVLLRGQIKRLEAELKRANSTSAEIDVVKSVIGVLSSKVEALDPPKWLTTPKTKTTDGVPTLMLSDWHGGERVFASQVNGVNEYSVAVMRARAKTLVDSTIHLLQIINPKMDYPGIVLVLGGDMISGNIHDELTATNELNSMPAVLEMFEILTGIIGTMADTFGRVFVPCVGGNHGRDTHKIWNKDRHHTSFDWLLYQFLARRFKDDKRITFYIPDSTGAYYKIFNHAYWLVHGDGFRGGDGMIGCLGPILRGDHKTRSRNAQIDQSYDTMLMGHWHQYIHHGRVIVNGSLKGYDEYAFNNGFGFEVPQQALWLTHPTHGITFRMPVYVDDKRKQATTDWVSVPK